MTADLWGLIGKNAWLGALMQNSHPHEVVGWRFESGLQLALLEPDTGKLIWTNADYVDCFTEIGVERPSPSRKPGLYYLRGLDTS